MFSSWHCYVLHMHMQIQEADMRREGSVMKSMAKSISSQIVSSGGRAIWLALDGDAALGLQEEANWSKGHSFFFLGSRCKQAQEILDLLKGYGAGRCSRIMAFRSKPRTTQIIGLLFDNAHHVATVLDKLKERHFRPHQK